MTRSVIIGIIILLLLILIVKQYSHKSHKDTFLNGVWNADKEFLEQSDLKEMHLFVAPQLERGMLKAFLLMSDKNGDTITKQVIWIKNPFFGGDSNIIYSDKDFTAIPETVRFDIDPMKGTLMVYSGSKLYGFLIKNNEMSLIANETYNSTPSPPN